MSKKRVSLNNNNNNNIKSTTQKQNNVNKIVTVSAKMSQPPSGPRTVLVMRLHTPRICMIMIVIKIIIVIAVVMLIAIAIAVVTTE